MRRLSTAKRTQVVAAMVEGCSVASIVRMYGVNKRTVLRLLVDLGKVCAAYHDLTVRGLSCKRIQLDELWAFVGAKRKSVERGAQGHGDAWTWTAIDADTKLCIAYHIGTRDIDDAASFIYDLKDRLATRAQVTSDGHRPYVTAIGEAFNGEVDFAQLIKIYGPATEGRYSPGECIGTDPRPVFGRPDPAHISTSYVERQNLTVRMSTRRFTRLTNAFSKKIENHEASVQLFYFFYNFMRVHQTIKRTPAMAAGLADHAWTAAELVNLLEQEEARCGGGRIKD